MKVTTSIIDWPLRQPFTIARETLNSIACIQATLTDAQGHQGRGEAVGVDYAGETPASMVAQIEAIRTQLHAGLTIAALQTLLPAGGARNALDCALWDLNAKRSGVRAWRAAGLDSFAPRPTSFTFGMMDEQLLRAAARKHAHFPLLKVKTDRHHGLDPARIVHEEAPNARLILDANTSWGEAELRRFAPGLEQLNIVLLEQPVAPHGDEVLRRVTLPVPVAADEAFNDRGTIAGLAGKYQVLNIKLDKTGGLTEALACARAGLAQGYRLMVGCMVGSSLSMAPGVVVAQLCDYVDLDGPLLQSRDVGHPIEYRDGTVGTPDPALWG
jgi:L-alanine-DL-glutamate epimerase-like enolase superfamily enzyme